MTTPLDYLAAVRRVLDHLEQTQLPAIDGAADLVVEALTHRGAVWCAEIGHGIQGDFINRAGGLAAVQLFHCGLSVTDRVARGLQDRPQPEPVERDLETVRLAVRASNLRPGDVLVLGSVSGRNRGPVELALACRAQGVRTVGLTSLIYTREVVSAHPSGKKLAEVVDVVIDNGAPFGDAAVRVPGYDIALLPVSGAAGAVIGHLLWGGVMEKMAAAGTPAAVFLSLNRPDGKAWYDQALAQYEERGY